MRGSATPERRVRRLASGLVIGQVAAAVVLLAATTATLATTLRLADVETGITNDRAVVFELTLPEATYPDETAQAAFFERVATRIAGHSDVGSIGATDLGPGSSQSRGAGAVKYFGVPDPPYDVSQSASYRVATPGYFKTMGIRLLEGRAFQPGDRLGAPRVAVVSAGVARALEPDGSSVIGRRIESRGRKPEPVEIVGVVADVRLVGLAGWQELQIYYPLAQEPSAGGLAVAAHATRDTDAAFEAVLGALRAVDPELPPYNVSPIHDLRARYLASERLTLTLSGAFSAVALLLCAIGLYGVLSQAVSQRTREIGVRMALGADRRAVQGQVVWSGLRLAAAGALVGGAVSLAAARAITRMVPTVDMPRVELIAADAAVLLLVAILAAWIPGRRASVIDPVRALRAE
jgi:putative ABC transport system permease protein